MGKPSLLSVALILFNVMLAATGQIVLKIGTSKLGGLIKPNHSILEAAFCAIRAMFTPYIFAGLMIYAFSAITWIIILSRVDLSFAYPMISLSYVLVVILSALILSEKIPLIAVPGLLLICIGVSLIGIGYSGQR
ncbi:MAG: hypothetical protein K6T99_03970 [Armatimonadetes bacterium]|nr:hypothetical protein [Armatimonadota bacterium]